MDRYLKERNKWWPVSAELMSSYCDGSHTYKYDDGTQFWYKKNLWHRSGDKPAIRHMDDTLQWYKNGEMHRDRDKPAIIYADGTLVWFKNGVQHRDGDKPAWIGHDNRLIWLKNGKRHRAAGPAFIMDCHQQYYLNGVDVTTDVTYWLKKKKYKYPFTQEQQVEFTLTFG
jgi:hypothetical protein